MYHICPSHPLVQANNASQELAVVYDETVYIMLLRYEHQTSSKHQNSQGDFFLSEMHNPVKTEHFQMTNQTRNMSIAKLVTRQEACRLVPQFICCIVQDQVIFCI